LQKLTAPFVLLLLTITDFANYSLQNILPASIGLRDSPTGVIRLFNILRRSPTNYHRDHAGWIAKALPAVVTG